ncbi:MFS general substrate transporter [Auriculariales sp. MPI-PUGE-AT-0066]|nr:MFS general substrate transporter [Auriculariales sp. MPI-PUGE-AT-0066]
MHASHQPQVAMELEPLDRVSSTIPSADLSEPQRHVSSNLPPVDRGFHAYAFLFAHWTLELVVWSFAFSYAVFLPYYSKELFPGHPSSGLLSITGTVTTGLMYLGAVVVLNVCTRWPRTRRPMMIGGLVVSTLALVAAAFATEPWHLLMTWGIAFSVGGSALYYPASSYLFEWFVERRGFASGLIVSGTGIGGIVMPFVSETLLRKYGPRTTLLAMAAIFAGLVVPVLPFVKSRFPVKNLTRARQAARINFTVLRLPSFWILAISTFFQSLANSIPTLYLPTFALDLRLGGTTGVLVLSLLNGTGVAGRIVTGFFSDKVDLRLPILVSTATSAAAVLFLWGFAQSPGMLIVFAIIFGFFASGFSTLWPRFVMNIVKDDPHTSYFLFSAFFAARGSAIIASGPITTAILNSYSKWNGTVTFAYGLRNYGTLILFTGLVMFLAGVGAAFHWFTQENARLMRRPSSHPASRM